MPTRQPSGLAFGSGGSARLALPVHGNSIVDIDYDEDGGRIATISADGTAKVHLLEIDELIELARSRVTRGLSEIECQQYLRKETCASQ